MSLLDDIKLLIKDCVHQPDGLGNPMIDQHDADRYVRYLTLLDDIALEVDRRCSADNMELDDLCAVPMRHVGRCPVCGFDQTEGKSVDIDGGTATQECYCLKCDAKWYNTYTLRETTITWTTSPEQST